MTFLISASVDASVLIHNFYMRNAHDGVHLPCVTEPQPITAFSRCPLLVIGCVWGCPSLSHLKFPSIKHCCTAFLGFSFFCWWCSQLSVARVFHHIQKTLSFQLGFIPVCEAYVWSKHVGFKGGWDCQSFPPQTPKSFLPSLIFLFAKHLKLECTTVKCT